MSAKELGIIAVAGGGQDVVGDDVADGAPSEDVDDVEADGVIRFQEADILLSSDVTGLEVRHSVLLRKSLLGHVLPLEVEEDEPAQEERQPRAKAYHHRRVQLRSNRARSLLSNTDESRRGSRREEARRPSEPLEGR